MIRKLAIINYILLIYSGLIKWIPGIPFDLTLVLGGFAVAFTPFIFSKKNINIRNTMNSSIIVSILILSVLFILSNVYSISTVYAKSKTLAIALNSFCFIYPLVLFRKSDIKVAKITMLVLSFIILITLFIMYLNNQFIYFQMSEETLNSVLDMKYPIPNYLSIGTFLGASIILFLDQKKWWFYIYITTTIVMLFLLGGRGPLLFLPIIFLFYYFSQPGIKLFNTKNIIFILTGLIFFILFFDFSIIDFERFNFFQNISEDKSSIERLNFYSRAISAIGDYPLFGQGIGSSGLILSNMDTVLYPHNLFLESIMEVGLLGGILYMLIYIKLFSNIIIFRKNIQALLIGLIIVYLFFQDMKSGSFDAWRISLMWIAFFIIACRTNLTTTYHKKS